MDCKRESEKALFLYPIYFVHKHAQKTFSVKLIIGGFSHNTVLRYPGSKWRIADQLVSNIPEHKSYLEPYFGSGAVLFNKPPSPIETINDLDDDVINLFQCIRDHSQQLAAMIAAIPYSRKVYDSQFSIVSKNPVDKACAFLIKCWQGYGFKTSGIKTGWKRDKTGRERAYNLSNWYHLPEWIEEIAERLRNIQIEHKPALDLIREFDSPDSFFYLDPPYLLNTRSAKQYQHEMTEEDHIQLLETIVHCSAQIMISGYDTPLYNDYLHTWDTLRIPNQTTSGVIREEIVWMNYTHQLSLYDFGIL